jgi:hypothetical protein
MVKLRAMEWLIIVATLMLLSMLFAPQSCGSVYFFSPDTLQSKYRSESCFVPPDYWSSERQHQSELVNYLVQKGYWVPRQTHVPQWICTVRYRNVGREDPGYVHRALFWNGMASDLIAWSEDHPDVAIVFWPRILNALRQGDRDGMKKADELLWVVRGASSLTEIETRIEDFR